MVISRMYKARKFAAKVYKILNLTFTVPDFDLDFLPEVCHTLFS